VSTCQLNSDTIRILAQSTPSVVRTLTARWKLLDVGWYVCPGLQEIVVSGDGADPCETEV
jgi:hypothetical protein